MPVTVDKELCIGCGACVGVCPVGALELDDEMKRFVYVTDSEGKNPTRRYVKTGFKQGTNVEIREGLELGTKIVENASEVE